MTDARPLAFFAGLALALAVCQGAAAQTEAPADPAAPSPNAAEAAPSLADGDAANVAADEPVPAPPPPDLPPLDDPLEMDPGAKIASTSELFMSFLKMILMLGLVLAVIYLTLNKGVGKLIKRSQQGKRVHVVERIPLEQRRSLYVVNVDGREMLLAASEGGVNVLDRLGETRAEPSRPFRIEASGNARAPVSEAFTPQGAAGDEDDRFQRSDDPNTDATLTISDVKEG